MKAYLLLEAENLLPEELDGRMGLGFNGIIEDKGLPLDLAKKIISYLVENNREDLVETIRRQTYDPFKKEKDRLKYLAQKRKWRTKMASVTYNVSKISGKHSVVIRHGSKTLAYKGKFNTKAEAEKFANDFLEMSNTPTKPVLKEIIAVPELNENTTLPLAYKIWRKAFIDKQDLTEATLKNTIIIKLS
ncbi:hypothetical protein AAFF39_03385 [Lactococcus garvieae]